MAGYEGIFDEQGVPSILCTNDSGSKWPILRRYDLVHYQPSAMDWGYAGAGPSQTALVVLADATHDDKLAVRLHKAFTEKIIATFTRDVPFKLPKEAVLTWVARNNKTR